MLSSLINLIYFHIILNINLLKARGCRQKVDRMDMRARIVFTSATLQKHRERFVSLLKIGKPYRSMNLLSAARHKIHRMMLKYTYQVILITGILLTRLIA